MTRMDFLSRSTRLLTMTLALSFAACVAHGQQQSPVPSVRQPSISAENPGMEPGTGAHDPEQAHIFREMSRDRSKLRQKEIVEDTNQLMDLVRQLKDAVDKSNKDELSLSVVNTATEIEKLARSVKEKMRDGQ